MKIHRTYLVSYPRSGHHWLVCMLKTYFGDSLHYCEYYTDPEHAMAVCPETNCQKTHDFYLDEPRSPEFRYVVQFRNPEPAIHSWYRMERDAGRSDDFREFFRHKMSFWLDFRNKWARDDWPTDVPRLILHYEDLRAGPINSLAKVIHFIQDAEPDWNHVYDAVTAHWRFEPTVQFAYDFSI